MMNTAALHIRRLFLALAIVMAAIAPGLDAIGDIAPVGQEAVAVDHGPAEPGHGHECGPVESCSVAAIAAPDTWQTLDLSAERQPVTQLHLTDLWHPVPTSPVPIFVG